MCRKLISFWGYLLNSVVLQPVTIRSKTTHSKSVIENYPHKYFTGLEYTESCTMMYLYSLPPYTFHHVSCSCDLACWVIASVLTEGPAELRIPILKVFLSFRLPSHLKLHSLMTTSNHLKLHSLMTTSNHLKLRCLMTTLNHLKLHRLMKASTYIF